jgi:uncharacterized protein (TIGR02594 family)
MVDVLQQAGFGGGGKTGLSGPDSGRVVGGVDGAFGGSAGQAATGAMVQPNIVSIQGRPRSNIPELTPNQVLAPYSALADAVGGLGQMVEKVARPYAMAEGARAVTRDENGEIQVNWKWEFTNTDSAYNAAARQAGLAEGKTKINEEMTRLRQQHDGNPEAFLAAAKEYGASVGAKGDKLLAPFLKIEADESGIQHWNGLVQSKRNLDVQRANASFGARENAILGELDTLSFKGGIDTTEFHTKRAELEDIRQQRMGNQLLVFTPEQKKAADDETNFRLKASYIGGEQRRYYERTGDLPGALKQAEDAIMAEDGPLPAAERIKLLGVVRSHIQGAAAVRQEARADLVERGRALDERLRAGEAVPQTEVDATVGEMRRQRMFGQAQSLELRVAGRQGAQAIGQARNADEAVDALNNAGRRTTAADPAEVARTYAGMTAAGDAETLKEFFRRTGGQAIDPRSVAWCAAFADAVLKSSGKAGANTLRAADFLNYGTATDLPSKGDVVVFAPQAAGRSGHVGFVVAVEGDRVRYIAGNDGRSVRENVLPLSEVAGFRVPPPAGTVMQGVTHGPGSEERQRRGEVVRYATTDAVGLTARRAAQEAFDKRANEAWDVIKKTMDDGLTPTREEMVELGKMVPYLSDPKKRQEILVALQVKDAAATAAGRPLPELENIVTGLTQAGEAGQLGPAQRDYLRAVEGELESRRKAIDENPYRAAEGLGFGVVLEGAEKIAPRMPNYEDAQDVGQVFSARGRVSRMMENYDGTSARSLIPKAEVEQFKGAMARANASGVANLYQGLFSSRRENLNATLDQEGVVDVLVNATMTRDPAKFQAAMSGLDALYRADPTRFADKFGDKTLDRLQNWQTLRDYTTPEEMVKAVNNPVEGMTGPALERLEREARSEFSGVATMDKARKLFDGWLPGSGARFPDDERALPSGVPRVQDAMMADYERLFVERYKATRDKKLSETQAQERLKTIWGISPVAGEAIMKYPPEKYYPQVNGSHDWMKEQIKRDLGRYLVDSGVIKPPALPEKTAARRLGEKLGLPDVGAMAGAGSGPDPMDGVSYQLIAAPTTPADLSMKRPPGYLVALKVNGQSRLATDGEGKPLIYAFDPEEPKARARADFSAKRDAKIARERQAAQDRMQRQNGGPVTGNLTDAGMIAGGG